MYRHAEEFILDGDEEKAYVLLMRYMELLLSNQKKPGFKKHQKYIEDLLGGNAGVQATFDKLDFLARNLEKRYKETYPTSNEPLPETSGITNLSPVSQNTTPLILEVEEFYKLVKDPSASMLIIDCRPKEDYEQSKLKYKTMINVPEEILVKGVTVGKIKNQLSEPDVLLWNARAIKQYLILLDYRSCEFEPETPIWVMKDVIENWDNDFDEKPPVRLVSGGYDNVKLLYPMECDNPYYEPKVKEPQVPQIIEIQYPDVEYYVELTPQTSSLSMGPLVDRSKKLNAIKTYEERKRQLEIIQNRKEKHIEQSLTLEKELVKKEKQWQAVSVDPDNDLERQELQSDILQKENLIRELLEEVERLKEKEKAEFPDISEKDKAIIEERNKRRQLEEKERERRKIEEQQKKLALERQRIMAEKLEAQKRIVQTYEEPEVTPVQRPITTPVFDRTTKPVNIPERQRDFSPVSKAMVSI